MVGESAMRTSHIPKWSSQTIQQKLVAVTILAALTGLICSCSAGDLGAASTIDLNTTVRPDGSVLQELKLETNTYGLTTEMAESWFESLNQEGWEVTATSLSGILILTAARDFSPDEFQSYVPSYEMVTSNLQVKNYFVVKKFILHMSLRALSVDEEGAVQDSVLQIINLTLAEQRLNMSLKVTMPGKLSEANADIIRDNSAEWEIDTNNIMQGVPVIIASTYVYWPGIAGVVLGVLLITMVLSIIIISRRKNRKIRNVQQVAQ
jgi:hypothetical protein